MGPLGLRHYGNAITDFHLLYLSEFLAGSVRYPRLSKFLLLQISLFLPLSDKNCLWVFQGRNAPFSYCGFLTSDSGLPPPLATDTTTPLCSAQLKLGSPEKDLGTAGISYSAGTQTDQDLSSSIPLQHKSANFLWKGRE